VAVRDTSDGYAFLYPFGWQEVSIDGQDVVLKDVIEPLESVSVSFIPTEKKDVTEFGSPKEVAFTLADKVLTSPTQQVNLVAADEVRPPAPAISPAAARCCVRSPPPTPALASARQGLRLARFFSIPSSVTPCLPCLSPVCTYACACLQRVVDGRKYVDFEFTAKASNYTRHAVGSVTVGNGEQHNAA
jgi:hypothetical protein